MVTFEAPKIIHQEGMFVIGELWKAKEWGSSGNSSVIVIQNFVSGVMVVQSMLFASGPFAIMGCDFFEMDSLSVKSITDAFDFNTPVSEIVCIKSGNDSIIFDFL